MVSPDTAPDDAAPRPPSRPVDLVLLPGLHGTAGLFEPLVACCPEGVTPHVIDYPRDRPLSYEELVEHVGERLPASRRLVIAGESFAGPLALKLARRSPPGLRGVVLCATFVRPPGPSWARHLPWKLAFRFPRPSAVVRSLMLGGRRDPERERWLVDGIEGVRPAVLAARVRACLRVDAREDLRECPVPILYLQAERDRVVRAHCLREILAVRPDVRVASLPVTHVLLQLAPERACREILAWIDEVAP